MSVSKDVTMSIKPFLAIPLVLITIGISQLKAERSAELHKAAQANQTSLKKIQTPAPASTAMTVATPAPTPTPLPPAPVQTATPAPIVAPAASGKAYAHSGCSQWYGLVDAYDWDTRTMMAIMEAESGCDSTAVGTNRNAAGVVTSQDFGLFQINREAIFDPTANVRRAYGKFTTQGLGAWSVYNNGAYRKYLR